MKRLVLCLGLLPSLAHALGEPWGLCPGTYPTGMVPCDASCFGAAATGLGVEWVNKEVALQSQYMDVSSKWAELSNTYIDYIAQYSSSKTVSQKAYIAALDGVSKQIMASVELAAITNAQNVDNISTNFSQIRSSGRQAKLTLDNMRQFNSLYGPPSGDWMLKNIYNYQNNSNQQINLDEPLVMTTKPNFNLTEQERALYLSKDSGSNEVGRLLVQEQVSETDFTNLSKTLSALYVNNSTDLSSLNYKVKKVKQQMALSLLLDTLYLKSEENVVSDHLYDISNMVLTSDENGSIKVAQSHALNEEIVYSQGISNIFLNRYLKLKRAKNAVIAISNM